jgi:hypothetical protein
MLQIETKMRVRGLAARVVAVCALNAVVQQATDPTAEAGMSEQEHSNERPVSTEAKGRGELAAWDDGDLGLPFCGDEYPPLKGSPGTVICTKPCHPQAAIHLNEETGWVWRAIE